MLNLNLYLEIDIVIKAFILHDISFIYRFVTKVQIKLLTSSSGPLVKEPLARSNSGVSRLHVGFTTKNLPITCLMSIRGQPEIGPTIPCPPVEKNASAVMRC